MMNTKALTKPKTSIFAWLQKIGSALLLPISILPVAGIIYSIGSVIEHDDVQSVFFSLSIFLFQNLPTLILISVAFKFSDNSGESALFAIVLWLSFLSIQSQFIDKNEGNVLFYKGLEGFFFTTQLGISSLSTSIFGGLFIGLLSALLYTKTNKINGINILLKRMIMTATFIGFGALFGMLFLVIWPGIYIGIWKIGEWINLAPNGLDSFSYGMLNRLLLPFGLHALIMPVMLHSPAGGLLSEMQDGSWVVIAEGDSQIWLMLRVLDIPFQDVRGGGEFTHNGIEYLLTSGSNPGKYQQGFFPIMIFAFPAAGFAMTRKVDDKKQKMGIMIASVTPMLTGITEPFEFLFVFLSPPLYIFHAFFTGISFMSMDLAGSSVWLSSGWFVDVILFGIIPQLQGSITNFWTIFIIGPIMSGIYFVGFYYLYKPNTHKFKGV